LVVNMNIDDINNYPKTNNLTACYIALLCLENERSCISVLGVSIFFATFYHFCKLLMNYGKAYFESFDFFRDNASSYSGLAG